MSNCKELAKETRKDLKKAFPETKFSVTSKYNRISVAIMESDIDFGVTYEQVNEFHIEEHYEGEQKQMLSLIRDLIDRENYTVVVDGDYGAVPSYYLQMSIGKWDKPFKFKK